MTLILWHKNLDEIRCDNPQKGPPYAGVVGKNCVFDCWKVSDSDALLPKICVRPPLWSIHDVVMANIPDILLLLLLLLLWLNKS